MPKRLSGWVPCVALLMILLLSACVGGASETNVAGVVVTREQAEEVARNALEAYSTGDYAAWSRDWSPNMRAAIRERDFMAARERLIDRYGQCEAISDVVQQPSPRAGYVRWAVTAECQSGRLRFIFAFSEGGRYAESVYIEPGR